MQRAYRQLIHGLSGTQSFCYEKDQTHANVGIFHVSLYFRSEVVLPKYLKCRCVPTFEALRYAVLANRLAFVACLVLQRFSIRHLWQTLTLSSPVWCYIGFRQASVSTHLLRHVMHPVRDLFGRTLVGLSAPSAEADAEPSIGSRYVAAQQLSLWVLQSVYHRCYPR